MAEILLICDSPVLRNGLTGILQEADITFEFVEDGPTTIPPPDRKSSPELIIYGCTLLDDYGIEEIRGLLKQPSRPPLLVICMKGSKKLEVEVISCGAEGLIASETEFKFIPRAIGAITEGDIWCSRTVLQEVLKHYQQSRNINGTSDVKGGNLTAREREILSLVVQGHKNKEIADDLGISYNTVVTHVYNVFRKLGVRNRAEAIICAANRLKINNS